VIRPDWDLFDLDEDAEPCYLFEVLETLACAVENKVDHMQENRDKLADVKPLPRKVQYVWGTLIRKKTNGE
jgi:hypothetical protein